MKNNNNQESNCSRTKKFIDELSHIPSDPQVKDIVSKFKLIMTELAKTTDLGKIVSTISRTVDILSESESKRKHELYIRFFKGLAEYEDIPNLQVTDIAKVVSKLLQDDDDRKAEKYIHLCVNLGRSELGIDEKTYFLHVLSGLSHKDIEEALEFYIRDRYDLKGYVSRSIAQKELISTNDGIKLKSIHSLVTRGLLKQTLGNEQEYELPDYYLTSEMKQFIEMIYSPQDLTPELINKEQKESLDVLFITSSLPARDEYITVFKNKFERSHYTFRATKKDEAPDHKYIAKCYITISHMSNENNMSILIKASKFLGRDDVVFDKKLPINFNVYCKNSKASDYKIKSTCDEISSLADRIIEGFLK